MPSNKKFGLLFAFVFAVASLHFFIKSSVILCALFGVSALLTLATALLSPDRLQPFNRLWLKLGLLLGRIVSPIVLGCIFFVVITPVALLMRLSGRDELRLGTADRASYWTERSPAGPRPDTFKNQF